jgi:polyhydroxyalkanoate synthesis regulator phasin
MDEKVGDTKANETVEEREKRSPLYDVTRKVMLAAIGAAAIAQEELDGFLNRLAERGELAEKDARRLAGEMKERREEIIEERRSERHTSRVTATKADLEALNNRVAELNRQLDELKRSQNREGGSQG